MLSKSMAAWKFTIDKIQISMDVFAPKMFQCLISSFIPTTSTSGG